MGFINIQYKVLVKGLTSKLIENRIKNKDIFNDWDMDTIKECIKENKYYYKIEYINYPITMIDIEGLSNWAKENKYILHSTEEERKQINWDGTSEQLIIKKGIQRVILRKRLIKWVESKKKKDKQTMLLTDDSPIKPNNTLFYKKIGEEKPITEWIFPSDLINGNIYNYQRIFDIDYNTN
tara:strand:- start:129 stop:668 length:540 start_codon:yes stop_codon:yes gene_type:complete